VSRRDDGREINGGRGLI